MAQNLERIGIPPEAIIDDINIDYLNPLGGGSDATVYPGTWTAPVAVKVLHPALIQPGNLGRENFIAHFGEECLRLRDLRHENIVQFMGVCTTRDGGPGLVTEKMAETLQQRYNSEELSEAEQLDIFSDVAAGLSHLHAQGVVHRDLTVRNVLLTERTRGGIAKVADVGLSRSLEGTVDAGGRGQLTKCPGSQLYMPPEAFANPPRYNEKLDVFSFGVLMMSTIVRRDPSRELSFAPRSERQDGREREIPEAERRAADYDAISNEHPAKRLIRECLQNDPSDRPSVRELLEELTGLCANLQHPGGHRRRRVASVFDWQILTEENRPCTAALVEARQELERKDNIISQQQTTLEEQKTMIMVKDAAIADKDAALTEKDAALADKNATIADNDAALAEAQAAKEALVERTFTKIVRCYECATAGLLSNWIGGGSDFPTWSTVTSSPLPADINAGCLAVVHCQHLYVSSRCESQGVLLWRTADAQQWDRLQPPPGNCWYVQGLLSHDDRLYVLSKTADYSVLLELKHLRTQVTDHQGCMHTVWQELPNGRYLGIHLRPSFFIDKSQSRIVIAGGTKDEDNSISNVHEYCLITKDKIKQASWYELPTPGHGASVVNLHNQLHLLGGSCVVSGVLIRTHSVLSVTTDGESRQWRSDVVPETPAHSCGACDLFGTIAVAGGKSFVLQCGVHVLDRKNKKWLHLPPMKTPRQWPTLIVFHGHLLAIGGYFVRWLRSIEQLPLSFFDPN